MDELQFLSFISYVLQRLNVTVLVASESQTRELNQHRTKTIENEAAVEGLKRKLISERFERFFFTSFVYFHVKVRMFVTMIMLASPCYLSKASSYQVLSISLCDKKVLSF